MISTTSAIVDEFESLLGDIIKQKEELKGISDPVARRKAYESFESKIKRVFGIESDDYDSERDFCFLEELLINDSLPLPEYESFTFDDEPVMAEVNIFDEINTSELSYPGIGENVVLDEEEDTFTFTTRTFLPFVTYPEVLPTSYSTGSEDKIFNPGFPEFWKLHGSILWKDKAIPTISIDGLQSSLHKVGNLLSLKGLKRQKEAKTIKNRQGTKESRARVKNQPEITAGSARHRNKGSQESNYKSKGH
ncbi:hypothetical protein Tco_0689326 [Tanacetum coccineum]